jgi:hypothetical protein
MEIEMETVEPTELSERPDHKNKCPKHIRPLPLVKQASRLTHETGALTFTSLCVGCLGIVFGDLGE